MYRYFIVLKLFSRCSTTDDFSLIFHLHIAEKLSRITENESANFTTLFYEVKNKHSPIGF